MELRVINWKEEKDLVVRTIKGSGRKLGALVLLSELRKYDKKGLTIRDLEESTQENGLNYCFSYADADIYVEVEGKY